MLLTVLKKPATGSWREARRQNARAALLATAWEMVREDGLASLSLRELARRAGITTPTVYAYFDSKNAIFDAMFGEAAQSFADLKAELPVTDNPRQDLLAETKAFVEFCTSDVARYQLLFQHSVPGFTPSPESYAPAVGALEFTRGLLVRNGVRDPRQLDIWTAVTTGLVDQQISNDPGGDRWSRLLDDVLQMFLAHCADEGNR
jgi:AcrR family transcriptional regulator